MQAVKDTLRGALLLFVGLPMAIVSIPLGMLWALGASWNKADHGRYRRK